MRGKIEIYKPENRVICYRKTPLISTYVFLGLAMVEVLIFGGHTYFRGYDKTE